MFATKVGNWLAGKHYQHEPKTRKPKSTFDSGIGMAESEASRPRENAKARRERYTHRGDRQLVKARRHISKQTYTIDSEIITKYVDESKLWRPTKHELFALIMPMAHGKTTLKRKYGFIDVDDLMPGVVCQEAVDNLATEIALKSDWNAGMKKFVDEAERNLSVLKFNGPIVILVHDWATANRLGARVMGSFYLRDEPFEAALKGRTPFQKNLARLNRQIVMARDEEAFDCASLDEVEELCLQMCMTNYIPTGAPCKFRDFDKPPGYETDDVAVVQGLDMDLDVLIEMYQKFQVPKERVDFEVTKRKMASYRGFGITPGIWCETVAGSPQKPHLRFDGMDRAALANMGIEDDKECQAILKAHPDEFGPVVCAHWRTVGRHADDPECVFRLYLINGDRFQSAVEGVSRLLARSKFFMDFELSQKDRKIINDLRLLAPKKHLKIQASGAVDIAPDRPSLGSACTQQELEEIVIGLDILSEPEVTVEGCEMLKAKLNNETQHYIRDFMLGSLDGAIVDDDCILAHVEGETVQTAVLRNTLVLMAQKNMPINDEMLDSVATMVGYDKRYFEDIWYQMLLKANLLTTVAKIKLTRALVAVMWSEDGTAYDDWSMIYCKAIEEIVTTGKACLAMAKKTGAKHGVVVSNNGSGYVTSSLSNEGEWVAALALSNIDVRKSKVLCTEDIRMINAQRCLREMTESPSLAIADMFGRRAHKNKRMMGMLGHAADVLPETDDTCQLLTALLNANGVVYRSKMNVIQYAKIVAFSSTADGGLGGVMAGSMEYRPTKPLLFRSNGDYSTQLRTESVGKKQKYRAEYSVAIKMHHVTSADNKNCPSRRIASHGLTCADLIEQMCESESDRKQMSVILKA